MLRFFPAWRDEVMHGRGRRRHRQSARRAFRLDEVSIVPSRRTRDPEDVDVACEIDAYRFEMPILGAPTDSVVSPASAVELGRLGSAGVLHLEGLWTRYEHPEKFFEEIAELPAETATRRMQEIYAEPVKPELIGPRIAQIKEAGVTCAVAITPHRTLQLADAVLAAEPDLLVIQATIVSAEHVAQRRAAEPQGLHPPYELPVLVGGCSSYQAALHLMRTGAAGVLVGAGSGAETVTRDLLGLGVPLATALADARAARMRHLDETGVYCHVIADGGVSTGGDVAKAIACGADAVMIGTPLAAAVDAPGRGWHWGMGAVHVAAPGRAGPGRAHGNPRRDPARTGTRRQRRGQPHRRPAAGHGPVRVRDGEGHAEGRARGDDGVTGMSLKKNGAHTPEDLQRREGAADEFDTCLVVDFGAQYAQLIARRVREAHVYSEIVPHSITAAEVHDRAPAALILSGGPKSVHVDGAPLLDPEIYGLGVPILGICYGAQLIAQQLGGEVGRGGQGEYGRTPLQSPRLLTACSPSNRPNRPCG